MYRSKYSHPTWECTGWNILFLPGVQVKISNSYLGMYRSTYSPASFCIFRDFQRERDLKKFRKILRRSLHAYRRIDSFVQASAWSVKRGLQSRIEKNKNKTRTGSIAFESFAATATTLTTVLPFVVLVLSLLVLEVLEGFQEEGLLLITLEK